MTAAQWLLAQSVDLRLALLDVEGPGWVCTEHGPVDVLRRGAGLTSTIKDGGWAWLPISELAIARAAVDKAMVGPCPGHTDCTQAEGWHPKYDAKRLYACDPDPHIAAMRLLAAARGIGVREVSGE